MDVTQSAGLDDCLGAQAGKSPLTPASKRRTACGFVRYRTTSTPRQYPVRRVLHPPARVQENPPQPLQALLPAVAAKTNLHLAQRNIAAGGPTVRNDTGHPESIDPVTPESVHAALLIFPELAKLVANLETWVNKFYV
jgi:hypothetical protein